MRKRLLALLLTVALVLSLMVVPVSATEIVDSGTCGDNLTWVLDSDGTLTISGTGDMTDWSDASSIPWYAYQESITIVVIGDSVTSIGDCAFWLCTSLTSITIPDGVTSIGSYAFSECISLTNIEIPASVTSISEGMFAFCGSLTRVTIPDSITSIGNSAFEGCESLTRVTIPGSVTSIGRSAFWHCTSLANVTIDSGITSIGRYAFYSCTSLTSITIPASVTSIGISAFSDCTNLASITILSSVTSIGASAFSGCTNLTSIIFEGNAPDFGDYTFDYVTATAYYPAGNDTWTEDVMQDYGGMITWVAYDPDTPASCITGHTEGEAVIENEVAPTCTEDGSYDIVVYCSVCGEELSRETVSVPATGHTEGEAVIENEVAATCTENGFYDVVVYCSVCGEELIRITVTVPATGHTEGEAVIENEVAATCTESGSYDKVVYCSVCGEELSRETATVAAAGHTEGEAVIENEVAATETEDGSYDIVIYCTVCGAELSRETVIIPATGSTDPEPTEPTDPEPTEENPFTDVNTGHYFYSAVLWAVEQGITSGTSETTFSPFLTAERCQVVTFLWRAAGCPEPTSTENPFTDVNEGDYFYTAVLWAVENGITTGTSDTTFSPFATCERCQVVTFLYRYFGEPEVTTTTNPFTDVNESDYFYNAVLWAVENGITTGTSETTFSPFVVCERCQVVTFLYRALGE